MFQPEQERKQKSKTLKKVLYITMPVLGVVVYFLATAIMQSYSFGVLK